MEICNLDSTVYSTFSDGGRFPAIIVIRRESTHIGWNSLTKLPSVAHLGVTLWESAISSGNPFRSGKGLYSVL
jgi:hypothetical protein